MKFDIIEPRNSKSPPIELGISANTKGSTGSMNGKSFGNVSQLHFLINVTIEYL
jgi:hypothetical protein